MPTSDVRREIAERMRGPFDVCECVRHTYLNGTIFGMQVCARDELELRNGMRHLADLIDPTCHAEQDYDCDEPVQGRWWRCGACGERFAYERGLSPRFCPECGARLVSE